MEWVTLLAKVCVRVCVRECARVFGVRGLLTVEWVHNARTASQVSLGLPPPSPTTQCCHGNDIYAPYSGAYLQFTVKPNLI